jgi:serine/threonine protein kinase
VTALGTQPFSVPQGADGPLATRTTPEGELIGRYRLLELLGAGGTGEVYVGHDTQLDRPVAIKRLRPEIAGSVDRVQLANEARINARLEHPNIVRVYDFLTVNGADFIVSEYVEGTSLADLDCGVRGDLDQQLAGALAICRGLAFAHEAGVVHLDLKAENVLVGRDRVPKIADFGIAQRIDAGVCHDPTGVVIRGTFRSMSPEQTLASSADACSDLFSFGTLLYELFSGVSPFHVRGHATETIRRIRELNPLPLRELRADVPAALSELVQRLHRKLPSERPASAREVEATLVELVERRARRPRVAPTLEPPLERRLLTLLVCELGLAAPSESLTESEKYLRTVSRFRELLALLVERHEGHVLSAFGGRAVICMGYPRAHDNNCERASRLCLELRQEWSREPLSQSAQLRAGLDLGDTLLSGELAAGPALQAAVALCDAALPGEFLVSSRAQRLLRRSFEFAPRGELPLPGAGGTQAGHGLPHFELCEPTPSRAAVTPAAPVALLIGRETELLVLEDAWRDCQAGTPTSLIVVGAPGLGKSRLLRTFSERAARAGARVLSLRCRPEDQYSPFAPFAELLAPAHRLRDDEPSSRVRDIADEAEPAQTGAGDNYRQRIIDAGLEELLAPGGAQGLLLLLEDVHWLDHSSLALLRSLEARPAHPPIFLVLSGRPECLSEISGQLDLRVLELGRLSSKQAVELIQSVPGGRQLSHRLTTQILEGADGLPLLLEELTLSVSESIRFEAGSKDRLLDAPSSLTESLDRRLEMLGRARETANMLAALGKESVFAILSQISNLEAHELEARLGRLAAAGLVVEEGSGSERTLVFRHRLLRDAIYERIPARQREELHRRIASVVTDNFGDWLAERPDLFAVHFARSAQWREAIELSVRAGERAARRSCHFEACAHFRSALDLLGRWDPKDEQTAHWELHIRRLLCPSLNASDGWAAAAVQENNRGLSRLAERGLAPKPLTEIWASFAHACLRHDPAGVNEALASCADLPEQPEVRAVLSVARGNVEFYRGEFVRAEQSFLLAAQLFETPATLEAALGCGQELLVEVPAYLAWIYAIQGQERRVAERRRELEQCPPQLLVARGFGVLFSTALGILQREHESEAGLKAQRARAEHLLDLAEQLRHPVFHAVAEVALGRLRAFAGDVEGGLASMLRGYELYEETGAQLCLAEYAGFVAEAHLECGKIFGARQLIERVRVCGLHEYARFYRAELLRIEAEILLAEGRPREARRALEMALEGVTLHGTTREPRLFAQRIRSTAERLGRGSERAGPPR